MGAEGQVLPIRVFDTFVWFCFIVVNNYGTVKETNNKALRLLSFFAERIAAAALALANHLRALLSGGDAVSVAFKHSLGGPADMMSSHVGLILN